MVKRAGMFSDTFPHFPGKVEAGKLRIAAFQNIHDA
jgi:hypothetical protein